jgi:hypothetical protein
VGVVVREVPGEGLGGHAGGGGEGAGGLAFDRGADDSPAGGLPGVAGGGHGGGLPGTRPADGALGAVSAGAEGAHEVALLVGELWLAGKGLIDGGAGDEGGPAVEAVAVAGHDALLDGQDLRTDAGHGDHPRWRRPPGERPLRAGSSLIGGGCTRAWPLRRSRSRPISAPWWMCSTAMPRTSRRLGRCGRSGPGAARRADLVEPVDRPREAVLGRVDPLVECVRGTWYRELRQAEALVLEGPVPVHLGARRKMRDPPRDRGDRKRVGRWPRRAGRRRSGLPARGRQLPGPAKAIRLE